jgi:hypothetical protein
MLVDEKGLVLEAWGGFRDRQRPPKADGAFCLISSLKKSDK